MTFKEYKDSFGNYYQLSNSKDSPVTIFIHGVGLDNTMWYPQKKFFYSKPILFYDLINHGQSVGGYRDLNFDIFSKQLLNLINELKLDKVNIVGFSIGALIAQHFTERFYNKVNKLVLIASVYQRSDKQIETVQKRYNEALNGTSLTIDSIKRWFNQKYLDENPNVYSFFDKILKNNKKEDFLPAYKLFVESDNYKLNFKNFTMPTLIMTGENEIGSTPEIPLLRADHIS